MAKIADAPNVGATLKHAADPFVDVFYERTAFLNFDLAVAAAGLNFDKTEASADSGLNFDSAVFDVEPDFVVC